MLNFPEWAAADEPSLESTVTKNIRRWATYQNQWEFRQNHKGTPSPAKKNWLNPEQLKFSRKSGHMTYFIVGEGCKWKSSVRVLKTCSSKKNNTRDQNGNWNKHQLEWYTCQSVPLHLIVLQWSRHILIFRSRWRIWHQISSFSFIYPILQHTGPHFFQWGPIISTWLTKMLL